MSLGARRTTQVCVALAIGAACSTVPSPAAPGRAPLLRKCTVQGIEARCGSLAVPENRDRPGGRQIRLRVVVLPSRAEKPLRDAFTYLAGGPGGAATDHVSAAASIWGDVLARRDIVLVDQRGTGGSNPLECPLPTTPPETDEARRAYVRDCLAGLDADPTRYGTSQAADDLEAVRKALGYRSLNVYGTSYGATVAQVFVNRHSRSARTVVLDGGTLLDIPFYERYAANGAAALEQVRRRCAADRACRSAFPDWSATLLELIERWNETPVQLSRSVRLSGDGLASVVQSMTLSAHSAASIPLAVSRAAAGDYRTLTRFVGAGGSPRSVMYWTIMCSEPWVGLDARGPGARTSTARRQRRSSRSRPCAPSSRGRRSGPPTGDGRRRRLRCSRSSVAPIPRTRSRTWRGSPPRCLARASSSFPATATRSASTAASAGSPCGSSSAARRPAWTRAAPERSRSRASHSDSASTFLVRTACGRRSFLLRSSPHRARVALRMAEGSNGCSLPATDGEPYGRASSLDRGAEREEERWTIPAPMS